MKNQLALLLLLFATSIIHAQVPQLEKIDWMNLKTFTAGSFEFKSNGVEYSCKDCRCLEVRSESGVSGYLLLGDATFKVNEKNIDGKSTAMMIRLNPADIKNFITTENFIESNDAGFKSLALIISNVTFTRSYHSKMDAVIPDAGNFTIDIFSEKDGEIAVAFGENKIQVINFTELNKKEKQAVNFSIEKSLEIIERTPAVLDSILRNVSDDWIFINEGENTWSAFDVVGHLIHGEKTDWIPRMEIILSNKPDKTFTPFDRFAQYENSKGKSLPNLLDEFTMLRKKNVEILKSKKITDADLHKKGIHPEFGEVTLLQLLATWAVHDLNHIAQISRVMAKHYDKEVGPWKEYLGILHI